jgi:hyperosmotically inducible periplasmic protein
LRLHFRALRTISAAGALALAGLLVGVAGARGATATTPDAANISNQVRRDLVTLPWYNLFDNLSYQVNGGEVTLSGQVTPDHSVTRYDAENAVKRIPGVTRVVNNIEVLPISQFDERIRRAEYRAIFSRGDLGRYTMGAVPQFHIIVKNGHVTLDGAVLNQMDKTLAGIAANTVPNVFSVTNNLQID